MIISTVLNTLKERNKLLFYAGVGNLILFVLFLLFSLIDERTVGGINTWYKPMKFNAAFVIFLWTFALFLAHIPNQRKVKWISIILFICMVMETIPITIQAARGVSSHFNNKQLLDDSLYQVMGFFILVNTLTVVYIAILFFRATTNLSVGMKTAIQAGLIIFILGAISGGIMVGNNAHSIGIQDGGIGLPFFNWSTEGGDLRAAHFFTLHALQFIPLFVFLFQDTLSIRRPSAVILLSTVYAGFCFFLHYQAFSGKPFLLL